MVRELRLRRRPGAARFARGAFTVAVVSLLAAAVAAAQPDTDGDGVPDAADNCIAVGNNQYDANGDGYGNACDGDLDDDGVVGILDFVHLNAAFGRVGGDPGFDPTADLDGDHVVGLGDLRALRAAIGGAPGPSGLACAGSSGCALPAPHSWLPTVMVDDAHPQDGRLDQADIDAAKLECGTGCNLLFLADTYHDVVIELRSFPAGIALYGFGAAATVLEAPRFEPPETMQAVIFVTGLAPDGLVIRDMALDGRKAVQRPPLDPSGGIDTGVIPGSSGIRTIASQRRSGGSIANLTVRNFLTSGIAIADAANWTIAGNTVHDIGCNQLVSPCGHALGGGGNPWNDLPDLDGVPNHRLAGIGIILMRRVVDTKVLDNTISRAMKHGIEHFGSSCDGIWATRNNLIAGNLVEHSRTGIVINGGCDAEFRDNLVRFAGVPGSEAIDYGNGFECGAEASGTRWIGNEVEDVQNDGFHLACTTADDIVIEDNSVTRACQTTTRPGAGLRLDGDLAARPRDATVIDFRVVDSPECFYGLRIRRRNGVDVFGLLSEGPHYGVEVTESNDVVVRDSVLSADASVGSAGVSFDYENAYFPIENARVHTTTAVSGFASEARWSAAGTGPNDGDSVAYCKAELSPPEGCDNAL